MRYPFLSIIIPTYNSAKSIHTCIKSILSQTFPNYEIVIIDGISKDGTLDIIESFDDDRIKIHSAKDDGIYDAMNKGIDKASGEWVYFLGSDDFLFDSSVLSDISLSITPSDRFLYGNVLLSGNSGWAKNGQLYNGEFSLNQLFQKNIAHQAIFYHHELFHQLGNYNLRYTICADYDFNLRVAAKYKLKYFNRIISTFNAGGASTNVKDANFAKDVRENLFKYYFGKLHYDSFSQYRQLILKLGKKSIRRFKLFSGFYYLSVALYFKLKQELK